MPLVIWLGCEKKMRTLQQIYNGLDPYMFEIIGARDPIFWIENVFGKSGYDWDIVLAPVHKEWIELFKTNDFLNIVAPTGHSKTQVFAIGMALWLCKYNEGKKVLIISHRDDQARKILKRIDDAIENNEYLHPLKGDNPKTWNTS